MSNDMPLSRQEQRAKEARDAYQVQQDYNRVTKQLEDMNLQRAKEDRAMTILLKLAFILATIAVILAIVGGIGHIFQQ